MSLKTDFEKLFSGAPGDALTRPRREDTSLPPLYFRWDGSSAPPAAMLPKDVGSWGHLLVEEMRARIPYTTNTFHWQMDPSWADPCVNQSKDTPTTSLRRRPKPILYLWRATVCFLVHFTLHCSLHTPKPPRHTKSKTLFLCPSVTAANLRLAIEGGTHQMARVERQPRNPSRLAPTSHPAPAPPTTPAARRPGTPRNAAQVIGPFLPLCATALLFLKSSCRSRFPSVGFCWGEVKCDAFFFPGMLFLLSVCRAGVLCSRLLVRGTMRKYFILILLWLFWLFLNPHDPSPIVCAMPPGFVMLSCPACPVLCVLITTGGVLMPVAHRNLCCFFNLLELVWQMYFFEEF